MTHYVNVMGLRVEAPICSKCKTNKYIILRLGEESWTYHCVNCKRDIPAEEVYP